MLRIGLHIILLSIYPILSNAQSPFAWSSKARMPIPISNNAVVSAKIGSSTWVYSFGGISSGRTYKAISKRCFSYDVSSDQWDTIPDLPTSEALIALAASNINDTIYICGGYSVDSLGNERTNEKLFRFVPAINSFISPGPDVPIPTDDQLQVVWRDSLLYLISGWSNTRNIADVQIYHPRSESWSTGTNVPRSGQYMSFGASGTIIGDTIYYLGGARTGLNFPIQNVLRRGVIDPNDASQIVWTTPQSNTQYTGYRMAALTENHHPIWLGGSSVTYNYDGVAYNGSGPVRPEDRSLVYLPATNELRSYSNNGHGLMDLRGVGHLGSGNYLICGGMTLGPRVTDETWHLRYDPTYVASKRTDAETKLYNHGAGRFTLMMEIDKNEEFILMDLMGKHLAILRSGHARLDVDLATYPKGIYFLLANSLHPKTRKLLIPNF